MYLIKKSYVHKKAFDNCRYSFNSLTFENCIINEFHNFF